MVAVAPSEDMQVFNIYKTEHVSQAESLSLHSWCMK